VADLRRELAPDDITVTDQLALISIVGRNLRRRIGSSGLIFGVLGNAGVNIRLITQSSQEISIIVGVSNDDFEHAIQVMYEGFAAHAKV
jgi:aspartate kinase